MQASDADSPVCERCRSMFYKISAAKELHENDALTDDFQHESTEYFQLHDSYASREASAREGCSMCSIVHRISGTSGDPLRSLTSTGDPVSFDAKVTFHDLDGDAAPVDRGAAFFSVRAEDVNVRWVVASFDFYLWEEEPSVDESWINGRQLNEMPELELAGRWMKTCVERHEKCQQSTSHELPTRLLEIGTDERHVTLRSTADLGLDNTVPEYVALSHCWGSSRPKTLLLQENLNHFAAGLPCDLLAQNFQDALHVTRSLGYRYLWIDCLCIVQDDEAEWQKECPRMVAIYSNAALTIAAADARDADAGFLGPRHEPNSLLALTVSLPNSKSKIHAQHVNSSENFLLQYRGWACQELLLSRRTLYFYADRMYFVCQNFQWDERWMYPQRKVGQRVENQRLFSTTPGWLTAPTATEEEQPTNAIEFYKIVHRYSACSLTKADDRLPALSGIAQRFHAYSGAKYLAGIWSNDLVHGLGWICNASVPRRAGNARPVPFQEPSQYIAPSWSWASCRYGVHFWFQEQGRYAYRLEWQMFDFDCQVVGLDSFGQVLAGHLTVRGPMVIGKIRQTERSDPFEGDMQVVAVEDEDDEEIEESACMSFDDLMGLDTRRRSACLYLDDPMGPETPIVGDPVFCMTFASMGGFPEESEDKQYKIKWLNALALVEVEGRIDTFRRIGLVTRYARGKGEAVNWMMGGEPRTVTII